MRLSHGNLKHSDGSVAGHNGNAPLRQKARIFSGPAVQLEHAIACLKCSREPTPNLTALRTPDHRTSENLIVGIRQTIKGGRGRGERRRGHVIQRVTSE